jgi:hypothetical protein
VRSTGRRSIFALLEERPQPVDHLGGAHVVVDDVAQDLAQLPEVRLAVVDEAERGLGVAENRSERLVSARGRRRRRAGRAPPHGQRWVSCCCWIARLVLRALARAECRGA